MTYSFINVRMKIKGSILLRQGYPKSRKRQRPSDGIAISHVTERKK